MRRGKYLLASLLALLVFAAPLSPSNASDYGSRSASVSQTLRLTILPAMETVLQEGQTTKEGRYLHKRFTVYGRSNTPWHIQAAAVLDPGRVHQAYCLFPEQTLPDNDDDAFQTYEIDCFQELSWGDKSERDIAIDFSAFQGAGL